MQRTFTVAGRWPFPLDMLRRDDARAATPKDQDLIDRMSGESSDPEFGTVTEVSITLVMEAGDPLPSRPHGRYSPNDERWISFGWRVVDDPEIDVIEMFRRDREKPARTDDDVRAPIEQPARIAAIKATWNEPNSLKTYTKKEAIAYVIPLCAGESQSDYESRVQTSCDSLQRTRSASVIVGQSIRYEVEWIPVIEGVTPEGDVICSNGKTEGSQTIQDRIHNAILRGPGKGI